MTSNIDSLIQDIHAMAERSPVAVKAVFGRHDSELSLGRSLELRSTGQAGAAVPTLQ
jgi:hypothetical protein